MFLKHNIKNIMMACVLGGVMAVGIGCVVPESAYAAYADSSSYVYQGKEHGEQRAAINVVDDDDTVYTFEYMFEPHSDGASYRVYGERAWRSWDVPRDQQSHFERLASIGLNAVAKQFDFK